MNEIVSALAGAMLIATVTASESPSPSGTFFAIIVDDVDVSSEWYQSVLGVQQKSRMSREGQYDIVNLAKPGLFIELMELSNAADRPEGYTKGPFKMGFLVDDLEAFVASLPESTVTPDIIHDERHGLLMVQLRDPDDYILQVMQVL